MNEQAATELVTGLYEVLYPALFRYALHASGRTDIAEDVVQEGFMRLYLTLRDAQTVENPKAWVFTVVRHELARRSADWLAALAATPLESLDTQRAAHWREDPVALERSELDRLLGVLTAREEQVLLLRLGALKYKEIAGELGISTKAVCTLLSRALRKLQKAAGLESDGEEPLTQRQGHHARSQTSKTLH